ncbi:hypothetical protein [Kineococcus sp. SYSU DK005]|uniref:hypothetical protein n=1 Tax=Kineococcus sp. SYSU DK005 TaxID=3383126 RepID=UPI003D7DBD33
MDEFESLIHSIGENTVRVVKRQSGVTRVLVEGDEVTHDVRIELCLVEDDWDLQVRLIESMAEIRELYIDEVALDYDFTVQDECTPVPHASPAKAYSHAI